MKKGLSLFLALLLLSALCTGVFAYGETPLIVDEPGLLTSAQTEKLLAVAEEISERQQCDVAVALVGHIPDEEEDGCGSRYYDEHDYGYGPDYDGVLLLVDTEDGDAWIASCGFGQTAFTDPAIDYTFDRVSESIGDGDDWAGAVNAFLDTADKLISLARQGGPLTQADVDALLTRDGPILTLGGEDPQVNVDRALVVDDAGLLTDRELESLRAKAEEITERQRCDVVLVTVYSLEGKSPEAFADDYFDYRGYGYGANNDGILFLISMEDRDWAISTTGYGIEAFTDYGQEYLIDCLISDLSGGDYYGAFSTYLSTCDELLTRAREGSPMDTYYDDDPRVPEKSFGEKVKGQLRPGIIILSLVIGFVIALIPMAIQRSKVKNVKWQQNATSYLREGSMQLNVNRDQFMFANTTSRRIETQNRSGGHGGGSSTHIGSSGVSHGGSHGKF